MTRLPILILAAILAGRCATVTSAPQELIAITSEPTGADVLVECGSEKSSLVTPARFAVVRRTTDCYVTVQKAGFEKQTAVLEQGVNARTWGNLPIAALGIAVIGMSGFSDNPDNALALGGGVALVGLGGLVVDRMTWRMRDHDPKQLHVTLRPSP